jgi:hypothetical protein
VKVRSVPLRYVEGLNDARTKLADFINSLLVGDYPGCLESPNTIFPECRRVIVKDTL